MRYASFGFRLLMTGGLLALSFAAVSTLTAPVACSSVPRIEYTPHVTLEPIEQGKEAVTEFIVRNSGGAPLCLDHFATNCGCSTPEAIFDGQPRSIRQLTIPPGANQKMRLRWVVRSAVASAHRMSLGFKTNDPTSSDGRIEFVVPNVLGGVVTLPQELPRFDVILGQTLRQTVTVLNRSALPYTVVGAEIIALSGAASTNILAPPPKASVDSGLGRPIGTVEFTITPTKLGPISGLLRVAVAGGSTAAIELPLAGQAVGAVALSPGIVTLPRRSGDGYTYQAMVICSDRSGQPLQVLGGEESGPVRVHILPPTAPSAPRLLRIEWTDLKAAKALACDVPIRVKRANAVTPETVTLRVSFRPTEEDTR